PGSKHVGADLRWLRDDGFVDAIQARLRAGARVLGICGGLQMLGRELRDPLGADGEGDGLGLLPLTTTFERARVVRRTAARFAPARGGSGAALAGLPLSGYEIRHGGSQPRAAVAAALPDGLGWVRGAVLGVTVHGLFE